MKNFKIMALGASGAGKTVFLASMFNELSTQKNSTFKLVVKDQHKQKLLLSTHTQIFTGDKWPPGTTDVSEWTFTCQVETQDLGKTYDACQFTYFDYAGGRLTDTEIEPDPEFEKLVQQADSVLGLLDGQKIYAWLNGSDRLQADNFLKEDLPSILKRMQNLTVPIHFVITKWDILDQKFRLSEICEKLKSIPSFAELLVNRRQASSIVRIIPVSSVGLEFATMQSDGSMKKNLGKSSKPFFVEFPISCILPDKLHQLYNQKEAEERELENKNQNSESSNILVDVLTGPLNYFLGLSGIELIFNKLLDDNDNDNDNDNDLDDYFKFIKVGSQITSAVVKIIIQYMRKADKKKIEETLKQVKDEKSALLHASKNFYLFNKKLLETFPESKLV
ncbi:MAG: hypothetical protein U7127_08405 [Phormidium sp.]